MKLKVFYHICAINHCVSVVEEQMAALLYSGLLGAPELDGVYCFLTANDGFSLNYIKTLLGRYGSKINIATESLDTTRYERFTLESIADYLDDIDGVLYIHSKGVSQTDPEKVVNVVAWTRAMNYYVIGRWRECVGYLNDAGGSADIVGAYYAPHPLPHFQGNFWWARADYFKKLPRTIGAGYLEPELNFVFRASPHWKAMGVLPERITDLYKQPLNPDDYIAIEEPAEPAASSKKD